MPLDFSSLIPADLDAAAEKKTDLGQWLPLEKDPPEAQKHVKEPEKLEKDPAGLDFLSLVPESRTSRVLSEGVEGYLRGFHGAESLIAPKDQAKLDEIQRGGGFKGGVANLLSLLGKDIPGVPQGFYTGLQSAAHQALLELGLSDQAARDIVSVPDAFMGSPHMFGGPLREAAEAPRPLTGTVIPPEAPVATPGGPMAPRGGPTIEGEAVEQGGAPAVVPSAAVAPPTAPPEPTTALEPDTALRGETLPQVQLPGRGLGIEGPPTTIEGELYREPQQIGGTRALPAPEQGALPPPEVAPPAPAAGPRRLAAPEEKPFGPEDLRPVEAHAGPWMPQVTSEGRPARNDNGDIVYQNANGVRAVMENGVPWMEPTKPSETGPVPRNPDNRGKHHQTTEETAADDAKRVEKDAKFLADANKDTLSPEDRRTHLEGVAADPNSSPTMKATAVRALELLDKEPKPKPARPAPAKSAEKIAKSPTETQTAEKPTARPGEEAYTALPKPEQPVATIPPRAPEREPVRSAQEIMDQDRVSEPEAMDIQRAEIDALTPTKGTIVEHTTAKGKTLRGVIRPDISVPEAKEKYDKYAFKKGNGTFIREEHISKLPPLPGAEAPKPSPTSSSPSTRSSPPAASPESTPPPEPAEAHRHYVDAVRDLHSKQEGIAEGALFHPEIGPIDLMWGEAGTNQSNGHGLAKLLAWHPEVVPDLPSRLAGMRVTTRSPNRIRLEGDGGRAIVRLDWDGQARRWLLTAFDEKTPRRTEKSTDSLDDILAGRLTPRPRSGDSELGAKSDESKPEAPKAAAEPYVPPGARDYATQIADWKKEHGPDGAMIRVVQQALEDRDRQTSGDKTIRGVDLQGVADTVYGGRLADNAYSRDRLYDAIETGVNRYISAHPDRFAPTGDLAKAKEQAQELADIKNRLPTQTVRAGDKDKLQQFSTPPDYAFAATWAANLKPGETVIEPSAGTGGIAVHAMNADAKVHGNEISPRRRTMMGHLPFDRVTGENAEQIHNILPKSVKPTAVVMNPPFSSAGDRMGGKKVLETGAVHIEQMLNRLEPGGRLVAIVGKGMRPDAPKFRDWWKSINEKYDVRANIGVNGDIYRKYGTSFPTRVLVIDKVPPSGREIVREDIGSAGDLLDALAGVRDDRPGSQGQPVAGQPGGAAVAGEGQRAGRPGEPVRAPTGDVGAGPGPDRPAPATRPEPTDTGGGQAGGARPVAAASGRPGTRQRPRVPRDDADVQQSQPVAAGTDRPTGERAGEGPEPASGSPGGDTNHLRPDGSDLAVTPPAPELIESGIVIPDHKNAGELTESVYESYQPQRLSIEGAKPHPGPLVQSAAMASVMPPIPSYKTAIPRKLIEAGDLSIAQLESVIYAGQAHSKLLPTSEKGAAPKRRGFFIGDGTGVGKGREVAGIILDNKWQGRKKAVWVSEKMALGNDAKRDWTGLGQPAAEILTHNKVGAGDTIKHDGILFTTYDTLKSGEKFAEPKGGYKVGDRVEMFGGGTITNSKPGTGSAKGETIWTVKFDDGKIVDGTMAEISKSVPGFGPKTRVQQVVDWLGKDFDGVIAFDESHNMGNIVATAGGRGFKEPAAKALAGLELQNALPNARVVYVSATGATEVSNLAYADRLGLWGEGTAFPNRADFLSRVSSGGIAAMELVARDMKALGHYTARSLSYDGVEYDRVQHDLTPPQRVMYDKISDAWQLVLKNFEKALEDTNSGGKGGKRSAILSAFWGGHQRFFNQLITSLQMPSVIEGIDRDVAEGRQAVLQLVNTNEAGQERALTKARAEGAEDLEELDMSPRDQLAQLVDKAFPTQQYETYIDPISGTERVRPVLDSEGNPVHNPDAVAAKEKLLTDLGSLDVPDGPLEILMDHYGPEAVAEVTGRKRRVVRKTDEKGKERKVEEKRGAQTNIAEANDFQSGKKKILVFSQAGGTGRSYHDDMAAQRIAGGEGGARRSHYLIQAGWRGDVAVQGFGRSHRTNQFTAPIFHLVTTNLEGQKRFISSIARRLGQLGALTRGERRTGDQGMFGLQDNLESDEAKAGLTQLYRDIHAGNVEGFTPEDLSEKMGLNIVSETGGLRDELPPMTQFLNRVLSLRVNDQNKLFTEFSNRFRDVIDQATQAGTLDAGTETYKADKIAKAKDQVVYTDPESGAETRHVHLKTSMRNYPVSFSDVMDGHSSTTGYREPDFFVVNNRSGNISAVSQTTYKKVQPNGDVTQFYRVSTPVDFEYMPKDQLHDAIGDRMTRVTDKAQARRLWDDRIAKTPEFRDSDLHIITGAILPIWDRLTGQPKIFRLQTEDGERMLGRVVPNKSLNETLEKLGAEKIQMNIKPAAVVDSVLDGQTVNLANGWKIVRRKVANEWRLELTGSDLYSHTPQLEADGVFRERIGYATRYFIPTGERGAVAIEAIIRRRPIVSMEGD